MRIRSPEWLWKCSRKLHASGWKRLSKVIKFINYLLHKTLLPAEAKVGTGIVLEHYALGIVLHPNIEIGDDVRIYHQVTIAGEMLLGSAERIVVGDRVTIGTGATIIAPPHVGLTIGDDATIGAGAVVTGDVPARAVVCGVPARVLRYRSEEEIQDPFVWSLKQAKRRVTKDDQQDSSTEKALRKS